MELVIVIAAPFDQLLFRKFPVRGIPLAVYLFEEGLPDVFAQSSTKSSTRVHTARTGRRLVAATKGAGYLKLCVLDTE